MTEGASANGTKETWTHTNGTLNAEKFEGLEIETSVSFCLHFFSRSHCHCVLLGLEDKDFDVTFILFSTALQVFSHIGGRKAQEDRFCIAPKLINGGEPLHFLLPYHPDITFSFVISFQQRCF